MAGAFYLITIIAGVFAEVVVRGSVLVPGDAAATAANILANESLYRMGLAADLVMLASYIVVTVLLFVLFEPVSRILSMTAAFFSLIGIAVLAVNALNHLAPLVLLGGATYLGAFETSELQALALTCLRMHSRAYGMSAVFFGVYCIAIGVLAWQSRLLPRVIGVIMAIGGASYLTSSFVSILAPALATRLPDVTIIGGIAELSFCLWLLVMSVDAAKWTAERAEGGIP